MSLAELFGNARVDAQSLFRLGAKLNFVPPSVIQCELGVFDGIFEIESSGCAELANGSRLYRFYSANNEFVQIVVDHSQIIDAKFFVIQQVLNVETLKVFDEYIAEGGALRQAHMDFGGWIWERCWGDPLAESVPAKLQEIVIFGAPVQFDQYEVFHSCQLYQRLNGELAVPYYLLVSAEDAKHGYELSYSIGIDVDGATLFGS